MIDKTHKKILRRMVADLTWCSGCACCRDVEGWNLAQQELAHMLDVEPYEDGSGYDFYKYRSKEYRDDK